MDKSVNSLPRPLRDELSPWPAPMEVEFGFNYPELAINCICRVTVVTLRMFTRLVRSELRIGGRSQPQSAASRSGRGFPPLLASRRRSFWNSESAASIICWEPGRKSRLADVSHRTRPHFASLAMCRSPRSLAFHARKHCRCPFETAGSKAVSPKSFHGSSHCCPIK